MGLGNVAVNVVWKAVVVATYAALYELSPLRLPADAWWAWVLLFFADDLAYYWFHRVSHESRVHHGSNEQYLDKDYGGILIIWDRPFGTFEPEGERVRYGLTTNIETFNPVRVAFHEYAALLRDVRSARGWRLRLSILLRGPGWAPEPPS